MLALSKESKPIPNEPLNLGKMYLTQTYIFFRVHVCVAEFS